MATDQELFAKLDQWLGQQDHEPHIFEVIQTGDVELAAAYILRAFRAAARKAAIENISLKDHGDNTGAAPTPAIFRVFDHLSANWQLTEGEKLKLLGLGSRQELDQLSQAPIDAVPIHVIERIATVVHIVQSLKTLLPERSASDTWIRRKNSASMFAGKTALEFMLEHDLEGIRQVGKYLLAQVYGS